MAKKIKSVVNTELNEAEINAVLSKPKRAKSWDSEALISLMDKNAGVITLESVKPLYDGEGYKNYANADRCLLWGAFNVIDRHFKKVGKGKARAVYTKSVIVYNKNFIEK